MKIIGFHIFIMIGFVYCLKKFIKQGTERNHGSPGVHKKQKLHCIFTGLIHDNLKVSPVVAGLVYGSVNIQLRPGNIQLRGKLAQLSKRQLKLTVIQHPVITKIPVLAGANHLKRALVACGSAHPDAAHKSAHISKGCLSHTADPEAPSIVFAVLIPQSFLEFGFHLILIDKLDAVLLIHAITLFLVHHVNQFRLVQPLHHVFGNLIL